MELVRLVYLGIPGLVRKLFHAFYFYMLTLGDLSLELSFLYSVGTWQCRQLHLRTLLMLPLHFPGLKN